jgi:hypothetical protein
LHTIVECNRSEVVIASIIPFAAANFRVAITAANAASRPGSIPGDLEVALASGARPTSTSSWASPTHSMVPVER